MKDSAERTTVRAWQEIKIMMLLNNPLRRKKFDSDRQKNILNHMYHILMLKYSVFNATQILRVATKHPQVLYEQPLSLDYSYTSDHHVVGTKHSIFVHAQRLYNVPNLKYLRLPITCRPRNDQYLIINGEICKRGKNASSSWSLGIKTQLPTVH